MDSGEPLTFFFSDVEGSTRAAEMLGAGFAQALANHRGIVRSAFERHGGAEVSTAGDSFFAVFPKATDALAAAMEIQRATGTAAARDVLRARIGLHTGRAVRVANDYIGLEVHRAARISDAGHGGQILVSASTHDGIAGLLPAGVALVDLGRHRLKDVGPERLWQVAADGLPPGPFPSPRSLEAHPTNLPADATPLIDRDRERAELRSLVGAARLVTVTGPGGIGKSRLAIAVARSLVADLGDGVHYLDLAAMPDTGHVLAGLSDVLALRIGPDEDLQAAVLDRLRNRDLLIVLDTGDRVAGIAGLVATIAGACPRVHVLVTSRSRLHVGAEREYAVGAVPRDAGVELFAERVGAIRPGFELDGPTRATVRRLVTRLDGIPLAIELAAARTRLLTPSALLDRLERRLPALGEGSRDAPDRQRTLDATIAWSCELLTPHERETFEQLSVLAGTFDLAAAEAIVQVEPLGDVPTSIETLVDRSLVALDLAESPDVRFRLLRPIRDFALAALQSNGGEPAVLRRHAAYWSDVVARETTALERDTGLDVVARIGRDEANIHQALDWMLTADPEAGAVLVARLARYWRLRGRVTEGLTWLTRAADVGSSASPSVRADVWFWKGAFEDDARLPAQAARSLEAALQLRRDLGDDRGVARALNSLGIVTRSNGNLEAAERMLEESVELAERVGDRRGVAMALSNLGIIAEDRDRHDVAAEYVARALEIDRELGGAYVIVGTVNLGVTQIRAGRSAEGVALLGEALPGMAELEDPDLVVEALMGLAQAAMLGGDPRAAARLGLAAEALAAREARPLHATDQRKLDLLIEGASATLPADVLDGLRAEVGAVDITAGLALAQEAIARLTATPA
jgi:predicted ATPase/class 3 adenylate cyclase